MSLAKLSQRKKYKINPVTQSLYVRGFFYCCAKKRKVARSGPKYKYADIKSGLTFTDPDSQHRSGSAGKTSPPNPDSLTMNCVITDTNRSQDQDYNP
jgi:hypothetical protein